MYRSQITQTLYVGFLIGAFALLATDPCWADSTQQHPTLEQLKQLFPGRTFQPDQWKQFRSIHVDLNGDNHKEWIVVEDPNPPQKTKRKTTCFCPAPAPKADESAVKEALSAETQRALYQIQLIPTKRGKRLLHHDLQIWWNPEQASSTDPDIWMRSSCQQLGKLQRKWRRWRLRQITFVRMDNGQTTSISWARCHSLQRFSQKRGEKIWTRWSKADVPVTIKTCPCPKKKDLSYLKAAQPFQVTVIKVKAVPPPATPNPDNSNNSNNSNNSSGANTPPPPERRDGEGDLNLPSLSDSSGSGTTTATSSNQYEVIGSYQADNVQITPLTESGTILALRLERTRQGSPTEAGETVESLYVYDEGNSQKMKQVFSLKTGRSNDPADPGTRQWIDLQFRNMDADHWLEIIADVYYENTQFSGRVARKMFKWHHGKYVPLNEYRGIYRVRASSTWTQVAPEGTSALQRFLSLRASANNLVDGFRDTVWVGGKMRRSLGDFFRIEWGREVTLTGIGIFTQPPQQLHPVVRSLWQGEPPQLKPAQYLKLKTPQGEMTVALKPEGGFQLVRFPSPINTGYLQITLVEQYIDPQTRRTVSIQIPDRERSHGFLSEIIPLTAEIRYTASSYGSGPDGERLPEHAGDSNINTAWSEGRSDAGIGEWLQMILPTPQSLTQLTVVNGCRRAGENYSLNHRVKEAQLTFSDGSTQDILLKDVHQPQIVKLRSVQTRSVRLTIRSIYPGKLGHTTCLSEFRP